MINASVREPKVGMKVNWKTQQEGCPDDMYLQADLIYNYGKREFKIATVTPFAIGKLVTLEKEGQIIKRKDSSGSRVDDLLLSWAWLKPVE
jgi:hypothetical protein